MEFGQPFALLALAATPLALAIGIWTLRWRRARTREFFGQGGAQQRLPGGGMALVALLLITAAVAAAAFAAARPRFGETSVPTERRGVAVVIALDVSQSMAARDVAPSRFAAAVQEIDRYLATRRDDRVGLVIFAGGAFVRFPTTDDHAAATRIVHSLEPGEALVPPGSDIAAAIDVSRDLLERREASTRAIVLVSDGEALQGDALIAAGDAANAGLRIFAAGIGTEGGATIPVFDPGQPDTTTKIDAATGEPVITRLDRTALQALAAAGGGRFVHLDRAGALASLGADFNALEASTLAVGEETVLAERFAVFVGLGVGLLLAEAALSAGFVRLRRRAPQRAARAAGLAGLLGLGLLTAACASETYRLNQEGTRAFDEGRYADALEHYRAAQQEAPGDPLLSFNTGRALHALGAYGRAETETAGALRSEDREVRARALYNIGLHRWERDELVGARTALVESLTIDPTDLDAKINLELVNAALARLASEQQANPSQGEASQEQPGSGQGQGEQGEEGEPGQGSQNGEGSAGEGAGSQPVQRQSGGSGEAGNRDAPPPGLGAEQSVNERQAAQDELQAALEALQRDAGAEDALEVLDALRERPRARFGAGSVRSPVSGDRDW